MILVAVVSSHAREISLHGQHAVTVDADDPAFADPDYDDSGWMRIPVPSSLRVAGLNGRPDVFWYRITFVLPPDWDAAAPAIRLGVVTRSDETYLNGQRIGGLGRVGARLSDWHAYAPTMPRLYPIDPALLRPGQRNVLAIRGAREPYIDDGGIIAGPVALVELPGALDEFLPLQRQFQGYRFFLLGIETMIMLGIIVAIFLGIRSRFLALFAMFYVPTYLFSLEWRGVAGLVGLDDAATQFIANACGALALPALVEFVAHVLRRPVGRVGRTIQILSVVTLVSVPNTDIAALQWWAIESHLVWHALMLASLLIVSGWTVIAALRGAPYAKAISVGLLAIFAGLGVDIALPLNTLEREFGVRIGEVGVLTLHLSLAFVVVRNIADRDASLRAANAHIAQVHEQERARMARDLHDGIGQWLSVIKIKLDLLTAKPSDRSGHLADLSADLAGTIEDMRRITHDLAPALLAERGLIGAMHAHAERACSEGHVDVSVEASAKIQLDPPETTHVFRFFQEALSNALRHSGCRRVTIVVDQTKTRFRMEVTDDGCGFDPGGRSAASTLGLVSMRSRAELLGGELVVQSGEDKGTTLTLIVPTRRGGGTRS